MRMFIELHLRECCLELREWENTGIIPDGRLREAKSILIHPALKERSLTHVESAVKRASMEYVIATCG